MTTVRWHARASVAVRMRSPSVGHPIALPSLLASDPLGASRTVVRLLQRCMRLLFLSCSAHLLPCPSVWTPVFSASGPRCCLRLPALGLIPCDASSFLFCPCATPLLSCFNVISPAMELFQRSHFFATFVHASCFCFLRLAPPIFFSMELFQRSQLFTPFRLILTISPTHFFHCCWDARSTLGFSLFSLLLLAFVFFAATSLFPFFFACIRVFYISILQQINYISIPRISLFLSYSQHIYAFISNITFKYHHF